MASSSGSDEPQLKSKRPSNSAFKQQKLPAWQPILTAGTVLPAFFIIGLAFIPVGIGLLISSDKVKERQIEYTNCKSTAYDLTCAEVLKKDPKANCTCSIMFNITETIDREVYMYYGLTNYYQNHRRYVKSRDDNQLLGDFSRDPSSDCQPYATDKNGVTIAPCGAIANSLFNDVIKLIYHAPREQTKNRVVGLLSDGIAWPTDKHVKFRNPEPKNNLALAFNKTVQPVNWDKRVYDLDPGNPDNNGFQNEDLIVWMRTAALPTFRKLYRRIDHNQTLFKTGLPNGLYELEITYKYPVTSFKGTKRVILSNTSWLGGKNRFLGIAYITVGCICLILAVIFLVIHFKFGKSTQDLVNISQRTPY